MEYPLVIEPDDNETLLVTCPDLPEVTTFGENEEDALRRADDAIEEALAARMARLEHPASLTLARTQSGEPAAADRRQGRALSGHARSRHRQSRTRAPPRLARTAD